MTDLDPRDIARDRNWPEWLTDLAEELFNAEVSNTDEADRQAFALDLIRATDPAPDYDIAEARFMAKRLQSACAMLHGKDPVCHDKALYILKCWQRRIEGETVDFREDQDAAIKLAYDRISLPIIYHAIAACGRVAMWATFHTARMGHDRLDRADAYIAARRELIAALREVK